jgi:hypothetical protein
MLGLDDTFDLIKVIQPGSAADAQTTAELFKNSRRLKWRCFFIIFPFPLTERTPELNHQDRVKRGID